MYTYIYLALARLVAPRRVLHLDLGAWDGGAHRSELVHQRSVDCAAAGGFGHRVDVEDVQVERT